MPVVYDGVTGTGQGDLFQGLKLWISRSIPSRSRYVDLVKRNGGEISALEKNADMLIADKMKIGGISPPVGAYTYEWIEFSVKNGYLENKDDYMIRAQSSGQTKLTRTPFTDKDDLILTKWVLAHERKFHSLQGNHIYQELERRHPNHPWQSWRNRWAKTLSTRPRPHIPIKELELELGESPATTPLPITTTSESHAETDQEMRLLEENQSRPVSPIPDHHDSNPSTPATPSHSTGRKRLFFTDEEDQILRVYIRDYIQKARNEGKGKAYLSGNQIYKKFAEKHPAHSWHSWRDRALKYLNIKNLEGNETQDRGDASTEQDLGQQLHQDVVRQPSANEHLSKLPSPATEKQASRSSDIAANTTHSILESSSLIQKPNPKSDDERLKKQEEIKQRARAAKLLQRIWKGHTVRKEHATLEAAFIPLQSIMRGYLARKRQAEKLAVYLDAEVGDELVVYSQTHEDVDNSSQGSELISQSIPEPDRTPREQFYSDLQDYIEITGVNIDYKPLIGGVRVDLWDLFRIMTEQDCQPEERDMTEIADGLGLNWKKSPDILDKLQECYQNLADFEEANKLFANQKYDDGEEAEEEEEVGACYGEDVLQPSDAVTARKEPLVDPSSPAYRSSPPVIGPKRSRRHSEFLTSDPGYPSDGSRKRRRLDKNSVIPPTPETKLGFVRSQQWHSSAHDKSSPLKSHDDANREIIEISSHGESEILADESLDDGGQDELPSHNEAPRRKKLVEPETQDWGFATQNENGFYESIEVDDTSPSRQLQLESDIFNSPDRNVSRIPPPSLKATGPPSSSEKLKASGNSGNLFIRPNRHSAVAEQPSTFNSQSPIEVEATKRILPAHYQLKPNSKTPARVSAPMTRQNATLHPRSPSLSTSARPSGTAPARTTNNAQRDYSTAYISSQTVQPNLPRAPAFPAPRLTEQTGERAKVTRKSSGVFNVEYVDAQINHFVALGYKSKDVVNALEVATFERGPMVIALESLHNGRGVPNDVRGVWTAEDVGDLKVVRDYEQGIIKDRTNSAGIQDNSTKVKAWTARNRLEEKHGKEGVNTRLEYMKVASRSQTR